MQSQWDSSRELARAQARLEELTRQVERNTQILHRSQEREMTMLGAGDLATLFRSMTAYLCESYDLRRVTVVVADPDHDVRHLLLGGGRQSAANPDLLFVDSLTGLAPQYVALQKPWLGPYAAADHQLLFPGSTDIESIALVPLMHQGRLFGSINFGSADRNRYTHTHASDFLAHLGVIASFALENGVNRARLLRSGYTDVLTGWHNRRYLQLRLSEELARAARDGSSLVCLMLDVDHFKRVNDQWGHAAGDTVLAEIAQRIESQVRASDVAARYGGEEFVVLLPATYTSSGARLAERIRQAVSATPIDIENAGQVTVTASIGISSVSPGRDAGEFKTLGDSLLARADVALYRAKSEGRDRIAVDGSAPGPGP
ncbi:MAG: DUF484 family protein [Woeseiaceae bacterium]